MVETGVMKNSGKLKIAQHTAAHESPRTTKLCDSRQDEISLDGAEQILIMCFCQAKGNGFSSSRSIKLRK
jgi:hypothetical protein